MSKISITQIRLDGGTQPRDSLDAALIAEYATAMERGDAFPAVDVTYDGESYWLTDGFHRVSAAQQLGRESVDAQVTPGTQKEAQWRSLAANAKHGARRTRADLQRVIRRALQDEDWCKKSDNTIAQHLGCSQPTVSKYRAEMESSYKIYKMEEREVTRGGKTYTQDTANIGRRERTTEEFPQSDIGRAPSAEVGSSCKITSQTTRERGADEPPSEEIPQMEEPTLLTEPVADTRCTPLEWIELARTVLGKIDLDPATSIEAQKIVKAKRFYTREDNGLELPWEGRVWCSLPHSNRLAERFVEKVLIEIPKGKIKAMLILTDLAPHAEWWRELAMLSNIVGVLFDNVDFITPSGRRHKAGVREQALFYYGRRGDEFIRVMNERGHMTFEMRGMPCIV